ncbi:MAG: ABC-F family ATP-binding cassette domain-containing protein [Bacteroidales bacterium]|nr:ABC-F family ATP-binding cassette domain-containing protein [Bacteroidales bacterium]
MIAIDNISVAFNGTDLFASVSFLIDKKDKIGLVGRNGAGKSTLLKIIYGLQNIDSGQISKSDDLTMGYLPQQMSYQSGKTVLEETKRAFEAINQVKDQLQRLNQELAERTDYESNSYSKLIDRISHLNDRFQILDGHKTEEKIEKVLMGLGFVKNDFDRLTETFSGGWRMRIELAKILLQEPDVLLLDEPTNHLDIESIQWLEQFLSNFGGAVVLISHDRLFLDSVTNRTIEISLGKTYDYKTSYTKYLDLRQERRDQQLAAYRNQQKMIEDTEAFIERFRYKATKAVQVQSRIKQLEKIERIEIDEEDKSAVHIQFPPSPRSGNLVFECKQLSKSFPQKKVLNQLEFTLERGEKIAFVGKNGEGKTTLSRIIVGEYDYDGYLKLGHNVKIGYFAQNQDELLDKNKTVLQTLDDIAVGDVRKKVRDILGAFLFKGEDVDKKVSVLSGGEQSRLAMAKLLLEPVNFLVLDEPTNHLDILTKDLLKEALKKYDGTLVVVSHDRYFLDGLCDKIFEFKDQNIREHLSGIQDFIKKKQIENLDQLNEVATKKTTDNKPKTENTSDTKLSYEERKLLDKEIRKIKKEIESLETTIAEKEEQIASINHILAEQSVNFSSEYFQKYYSEIESAQKDLDNAMHEWEKKQYELELSEEQRFAE